MDGLKVSGDGGPTTRRIAGTLFDLAPIGIEICDAQGSRVQVNAKCRAIFGCAPACIKGERLFDDPDLSSDDHAQLLQGHSVGYEALIDFDEARKAGRCQSDHSGKIYLSVLIEPVREQPDQPPTNYIVLYQEITKRKLAEQRLRDSEERFRKVFEEGCFGIVFVGRDARLIRANPAFCTLVGYTEAELQTKTFADITHPEHVAMDMANIRMVATGQMPAYRTEKRYLHKDGRIVWSATTVSVVRDNRGEFLYFLATVQDITQRKEAQAQLAQANERLALATASGRLGVWDWNLADNSMIWDDRMLELYGVTREQFTGTVESWTRGLHPDDRERAVAECHQAIAGHKEFNIDFRALHPDGNILYIKANGVVVRDAQGKPVRMTGINVDITEMKRAEAALRENESIFSTFLEHSPVHFFFKDSQARALRLSRSFETMLGMPIEQAVGKSMEELFPSEIAKAMVEDDKRILREGKKEHVVEELAGRIYETTKFPIFVDGTPVMLAGFTVDITERKRAEEEKAKLQEQLAQAHKMESVGRLAGGVAHDFNNMLGVMLGHLELAEEDVDPSSPVAANLKEIHKAAKRSAELTRQLLAFARKQTIAPKVLDLNETVEGMLQMLRRLVGENIELGWSPGNDIATVHMDPTQLHQILANLCINARDAIKDIGHIHIATSRVQPHEEPHDPEFPSGTGEHVLLTVSDDGCGMDQATMARLFEPFFTTKELGRGTGLGLSTVHGVVKQNGGHISVHSQVGRGSTFRIYLPAHARSQVVSSPAPDTTPDVRGRETILLVEDEDSLLQMCRRMLEGLGYVVLAARGPAQAEQLLREHGSQVQVLVTDVIMPEMNGRALADSLREVHPTLRCLFMSGYTADFVAHQGVLEQGLSFLQKPFTRNEMANALRGLLDAK